MFGLMRKPKLQGAIGQLGLSEWWIETFTDAEKDWMIDTYAPMGGALRSLVEGPPSGLVRGRFSFLSNAAAWFNKPAGKRCAVAFAAKAMEAYDEQMPLMDRHFGLANQCGVFYRWREEVPGALEAAVSACELSISIHKEVATEFMLDMGMVPAHACFRQLRIIEEKRGNYDRAIEICDIASSAGWKDDWDGRKAKLLVKKERALAKSR